jgi:formylglycine-generating enzyme required for sulfatase activity
MTACRCLLLGLGLIAAVGAAGIPVGASDAGHTAETDRVLKLFADEFVPLTPGEGKFPVSFTMGSAFDGAPATERPTVTVTFRRPFAVARYEVTQELYQALMGKNPARWKGPRNSVEMVSWDEANDFCRKATAELRKRKLIKAGEVIRLPSEAEWEYACRAGTKTKWSFGDTEADIGAYAWYKVNAPGNDPPVGRKKPNAWGLHETHGYVWEWCADAWHPSHEGASPDGTPRGGTNVKERVIRGGAYSSTPDECRSAYRAGKPADYRSDTLGFRCVRAAAE